jgi:hypothetical protein
MICLDLLTNLCCNVREICDGSHGPTSGLQYQFLNMGLLTYLQLKKITGDPWEKINGEDCIQ